MLSVALAWWTWATIGILAFLTGTVVATAFIVAATILSKRRFEEELDRRYGAR